jgi:hypothetical protein
MTLTMASLSTTCGLLQQSADFSSATCWHHCRARDAKRRSQRLLLLCYIVSWGQKNARRLENNLLRHPQSKKTATSNTQPETLLSLDRIRANFGVWPDTYEATSSFRVPLETQSQRIWNWKRSIIAPPNLFFFICHNM